MAITQPEKGFIFWPVGTGDSTTVRVDSDTYLQIDLRHMNKSEDNEDPAWPIVDELIEILPTVDGDPYLSTFALTHPDKDHCQGFQELLDAVLISEIWMSPRTYREYENDDGLCEDAAAFHEEAMRRVKATIDAGGDPGSGDRIRIIGYDTLLQEVDDFEGFPLEFLSIPGQTISMIDGVNQEEQFEAFVHAPFKDDSFGDRNDCSLAFQITLMDGEGIGQALLMGDLKYPIVKRIFEVSDEENLSWNVLLAPHHCSKSVMYWQDENEEEASLKEHIVAEIGNAALDPGYVVASSAQIPASNEAGDNPPHAKAKAQYQSIVPNEFYCTHEHPDASDPIPVVFEVTVDGFSYFGEVEESEPLENALKSASAGGAQPSDSVGLDAVLSEGQTAGLRQLERIARVERSALRIDYIDESEIANDWLKVNISIDCSRYPYKEGGLKLHVREAVTLWISPEFPNDVPLIRTAHTRFLGFPHVQWGCRLCLYLSTETQWQPSQGMFGLIAKLADWFEKAALNELDALEGPLHPPVAYPSADTTFCMQANTPGSDHWPWFGAAVLDWRKDDLYEIVDWKSVLELQEDESFAPAILLNFELPFEYPKTLFHLLKCIENRGIETSQIVVHLMIASQRIHDEDSMYVVVGAPSRGVAGDLNQRSQHLQVWEIEYIDLLKLRGAAIACDVMSVYKNEPTPDGTQTLIDSMFDQIFTWQKESAIRWCRVIENRPEIVTRRDEGTPMDWFKGKSVTLFGCGALGGQIAEQLARAGVNHLHLYDSGRVHPGILVRQNFVDADINDSKAVALKRRIEAIAPNTTVLAHARDIISTTLNADSWHVGVDVVIDATASLRVRSKLESVMKEMEHAVPIVAMMISGKAHHGALVVTPMAYSGGPLDAYRRLGLAAKSRTWLSDFANAFWGAREHELLRQPEPGCSDPTFLASQADITGLAARMMNHAATVLRKDTNDAVGVLVAAKPLKQRDVRFEFEPDVVISTDTTEFRLSANAWRDVQGWIRAGARARAPGDETGGLLFGTIDEMLGVAWISKVSGPPNDSQFSPEQFLCGIEGTTELCANYDSQSRGTTRYVGTWHSHPVSSAKPSDTDFSGIGSIFAMNPGSGAHQLMMIIGHATAPSPEIGVYLFEKQSLNLVGELAELEMEVVGDRVSAPDPSQRSIEIGLALSGGGSRAVAFHLGTLRALEDLGLLDEISVISGVSGGSVMTGLLGYTDLPFREIDKKTTTFLTRGLIRPALKKLLNPARFLQVLLAFFVVTIPSVTMRITMSVMQTTIAIFPGSSKVSATLARFRWPIPRWYSRTHVMRDAISDLVGLQMCDAPTRQNKAIVFNACELRTTTAFRMSNSKFGSWRFGWSAASKLSVAEAITASAAFPPFLPPFDWKLNLEKNGQRKQQHVLVTDGGVFDNIGVSVMEPGRDSGVSAINHPVDLIIASDASAGQLSGQYLPASLSGRMIQVFDALMRKVNDATKQRLHKYVENGELDRFLYINLGQQDDNVPLKSPGWISRESVVDYPTNFSSMSRETLDGLSGRGETITRALVTQYLLSD